VELGEAVLCAGGVYISAGAYHMEDTDAAIMDQGAYSKGPIRIGDHVWIGTGAIILDGVTIGRWRSYRPARWSQRTFRRMPLSPEFRQGDPHSR